MSNPTSLQPVFNRVLVQLVADPSITIVLPSSAGLTGGGQIDHWTVLAIGPDVKCVVVGDTVVLIPGFNALGVDDEKRIGLIHDTSIIAKVLPEALTASNN